MQLPEVFTRQMQQLLREEYELFLKSQTTRAPVSVRLHPLKKSMLHGDPVPWCSTGRYLHERPVFTLDPAFHGGAYYVQEASSMFVEQFLLQLNIHRKPLRILDAAAAPGGKSTHLLSLIHQESLLVANEVIRSRVPVLRENLTKWGYPNVIITNNDAADFGNVPGFFDVIVLDAPCSGEGLFRKDPDSISQWSTENVLLCSKRQQRILNDLWPALKEGGLLIYSTCTYNALENEENIIRLLTEKKAVPVSIDVPAQWNVRSGNGPGYRFYPHRVKGEGFYVCAIQKTSAEAAPYYRAKPSALSISPHPVVRKFIRTPFDVIWFEQHGSLSFAPASLAQDIALLRERLRTGKAGTEVAQIKQHKPIPAHDLAMSVHLNTDAFPVIQLNVDDALAYLRKQHINATANNKGFHLFTYNDLPLGWANVLPGRINNLYPSAWRIRNL
ncbi:MAG: rRNA methyltransferase [Cyclobacteriaceae bacterium]|nr:rRNA methyltransferase [Cyclobacteriaceae bacterium]MDW8330182.1 rRNA methyltransferase [Cyclobacteriaceae bacterium]